MNDAHVPRASVELINSARELRREGTEAERVLWSVLRDRNLNGLKFRRQFPFHHHVLDFYCHEHKLGVELDGSQHADPENQIRDEERTAFLASHGIKVLRFWNRDVLSNLEGVVQAVLTETGGPSSAADAAPSP